MREENSIQKLLLTILIFLFTGPFLPACAGLAPSGGGANAPEATPPPPNAADPVNPLGGNVPGQTNAEATELALIFPGGGNNAAAVAKPSGQPSAILIPQDNDLLLQVVGVGKQDYQFALNSFTDPGPTITVQGAPTAEGAVWKDLETFSIGSSGSEGFTGAHVTLWCNPAFADAIKNAFKTPDQSSPPPPAEPKEINGLATSNGLFVATAPMFTATLANSVNFLRFTATFFENGIYYQSNPSLDHSIHDCSKFHVPGGPPLVYNLKLRLQAGSGQVTNGVP